MKGSEQVQGKIEVLKDGPYLVSGGVPLSEQHIVTNAEGESLDYREGKKYPARPQYALSQVVTWWVFTSRSSISFRT